MKIAFPGTVVTRTRAACSPQMPTIGCVPCASSVARGSQFLEFPSLPGVWGWLMRMADQRGSRRRGAEIASMGRHGRATVAELPWACYPGSGRMKLTKPDLPLSTSRCLFLPTHRNNAYRADECLCLYSKTQACRRGKHFREQWECPLRHHLSIINDHDVT